MKNILIICIVLLTSPFFVVAQTPSYSLWYEYGDGTFTNKSFSSQLDLTNFLTHSIPQPNPNGTRQALKKVTTIYPPKGMALPDEVATYQTNGTPSLSFTTTTLPAGKNLFIHSSTSDFIANDTLMLALNYRKTNSSATKLAFFYNSQANNSTFKTIGNVNNQIMIGIPGSANYTSLNQIRRYHNEVPTVANQNTMSLNGEGYSNGLVFDLNNSSNVEQNIFITLFTEANITLESNESFKLVFLDSAGTELETESSEMVNHSQLKSHDPNYEKVRPECVLFPEDGGKILHYNVHFQNTGLGPALTVETTTTLPAGYTVQDIQNLNTLPWEIAKVQRNNGYTIDVSKSHGNLLIIHFTKKPSSSIILKGTANLTNPLSDVTTMGDFGFDIKLKTPLVGPQDLRSSTSIVFDTNKAVQTNDAVVRVRKCCTCKEKKKRYKNSSTNKPCKFRRRFLQWVFCQDC